SLKSWLQDLSHEVGFDSIGFTSTAHDFSGDLTGFLKKNYEGDMSWLTQRQQWRQSPQALWPEAKTIIMFAERYEPPKQKAQDGEAEISAYALGKDYHDVVKKRLKRLGRALIEKAGGEIKVFVDTAPVMEKPLAQAAGIGWQGKHGNLLSRELGNWFFLGSVWTTLDIPMDSPQENHCGSCTACVDACPTNAFDAQGKLNPTRCISYLTIEHKGAIPVEFRDAIGNHIYGCDICLSACPWNKFDGGNVDEKLRAKPERITPKLEKLLQMDDAEFRTFFAGSAIKRIGWTKFISNCLIAAGNSNDQALTAPIAKFMNHEHAMIQESAIWAHQKRNR
ncbi:UNVERIFIED_CONTAM: hypothetical protein GTU68_062322, partial [Idotea baltica]|nr:hypothetical protein [Idotea baltica]